MESTCTDPVTLADAEPGSLWYVIVFTAAWPDGMAGQYLKEVSLAGGYIESTPDLGAALRFAAKEAAWAYWGQVPPGFRAPVVVDLVHA